MKVNINYNKLLDPIFITYSQSKYPTWICPPKETVIRKAEVFKKVWETVGDDIIQHIEKTLPFKREIIDVHIVSGNPTPFSNPIVLSSRFSEEEFISILVHELLHCLFKDNATPLPKGYRPTVARHILVYKVMQSFTGKYGFIPRKEKERLFTKDYLEAWNIATKLSTVQVLQ